MRKMQNFLGQPHQNYFWCFSLLFAVEKFLWVFRFGLIPFDFFGCKGSAIFQKMIVFLWDFFVEN